MSIVATFPSIIWTIYPCDIGIGYMERTFGKGLGLVHRSIELVEILAHVKFYPVFIFKSKSQRTLAQAAPGTFLVIFLQPRTFFYYKYIRCFFYYYYFFNGYMLLILPF
jgi:hypothetical protein